MAQLGNMPLDSKSITNSVTINVFVKWERGHFARLWLANKLLRLAKWVSPLEMKYTVEQK